MHSEISCVKINYRAKSQNFSSIIIRKKQFGIPCHNNLLPKLENPHPKQESKTVLVLGSGVS